LTDAHYAFLDAMANRSSVSIAELIRRALDSTYGPAGERRIMRISHRIGRRSGRQIG